MIKPWNNPWKIHSTVEPDAEEDDTIIYKVKFNLQALQKHFSKINLIDFTSFLILRGL